MQGARYEALEQLPLAENDLHLRTQAPRNVVEPLHGLAHPHEPPEQPGAPGEEHDGRGEQRRQGERAREDGYLPLTFLISAEIAGRISWRSPITA